MNAKQATSEAIVVGGATDERRKPTCAVIHAAQDDYLASLCAKKVNRLSCRCSGCDTDDRYPVIDSAADAPLLNTAYDGNGGLLSAGADPHWEVGLGTGSGPVGVSFGPALVVATPDPAWVASPFGNANWISNAAEEGEDAYFRYRFNLGSAIDPSTFALTMNFYADNRVWEIYVNGVPEGSPQLPQFPADPPNVHTPGFKAGNEVHITLGNNWRPCENELIIHVKSPGGVMGFLAQNAVAAELDDTACDCHCECAVLELPSVRPCISVTWGESPCDCLETDDVEVLCVTVCNCYSNVTMSELSIGQIRVTDTAGNPVPTLPDGTPSVQVFPSGPICFGDIPPCKDKDHPGCVSRELVLYTRGAVGKNYRLSFSGICFGVCHQFQLEQCFTMKVCQD